MSTSLPDLCRSTIVLLDRYQEAREAALKATESDGVVRGAAIVSELAQWVSDRFQAIGDELPEEQDEPWYRRSTLAWSGIVDAEVWSVELARLAAASEPAPAVCEGVDRG